MSRLERYHNKEKEEVLDKAYKINPINNEETIIKRERKYQAMKLRDLNITSKLVEDSNHKAKELFDIEEAFKALEKDHLRVDHDTQLEIMNELFTINKKEEEPKIKNNLINNALSLKERLFIKNKEDINIDEYTNKIYISENELINILEQKEHEQVLKHNKTIWDSNRLSKTRLFDKDNLNNGIRGIDKKDLLVNRLFLDKNNSEENKLDKITLVLVIIIIALLLFLAYLVFSFFNK